MNKILTLYNIEYKRIQKIYFSILGVIVLLNCIIFFYFIYDVKNQIQLNLNLKDGIKLLKSHEAVEILQNQNIIYDIYMLTFIVMTGAIIWGIYYSLAIWYKDFSSKTRSAYTLFMLPINKFQIYISKFITVLVLLYGIILIQNFLWIIEMFILRKFTGITFNTIIDMINYSNYINITFLGVSIFPMEYLISYILMPILVVSILFSAVIIQKSFNKVGGVFSIVFVLGVIILYFYMYGYYYSFSDELLKYTLIFQLISFLISTGISYFLVNKKLYV